MRTEMRWRMRSDERRGTRRHDGERGAREEMRWLREGRHICDVSTRWRRNRSPFDRHRLLVSPSLERFGIESSQYITVRMPHRLLSRLHSISLSWRVRSSKSIDFENDQFVGSTTITLVHRVIKSSATSLERHSALTCLLVVFSSCVRALPCSLAAVCTDHTPSLAHSLIHSSPALLSSSRRHEARRSSITIP